MVVPLNRRGIRARSKDPSELARVSEGIGTNRGEGSQRDRRRDGCGSTPIDEDRWVGSFLARVVERPSISRGPSKTVLSHEDTWVGGGRYVVDTEPRGRSRETKKKERNDPDPTLDWTMEDIGDEKTRWRIVQGSIPHGTRTTKRVLVVRKIRVNSHPPKRERNMRSSTSEEENEGDAVNEPGQSKGSDVTEPIFPNEREFLVRMQIVDCAKEDVGQCRHDGRDTPRKSLS